MRKGRSAAYLKSLRKKHKLGEYAKRKKKRLVKGKAWADTHRWSHLRGWYKVNPKTKKRGKRRVRPVTALPGYKLGL